MANFVHAYKYVTERPVMIQDCDLWINADRIEQMQKDGDELIVSVTDGCGTKYIVDPNHAEEYDDVIDRLFHEPEQPMKTLSGFFRFVPENENKCSFGANGIGSAEF